MKTTRMEGTATERRMPSWLGTGIAGGSLSAVIVVAVLAAAVTIPGSALLGQRPDANVLAYANSGPGSFSPLDEDFVRGRLGNLFPEDAAVSTPLERRRTRTSKAAGRTPLPPPVNQEPLSNDEYSNAYSVAAVPFRGATKTAGASRESNEPVSCLPVGGTVWYRYTASSNDALFVNTFGSGYSLTLGVFWGDSLSDLKQVACATSTAGNASSTFPVVKGRTYYFQLTGPVAGGQMLFTLVEQGRNYEASATPAPGLRNSFWNGLSADGRYVIFVSAEPQHAPRPALCTETKFCLSLMVRDTETGETRRVASTVSSYDENDPAYRNYINFASISADGSTVAFEAAGPGISPDKSSVQGDVFVASMRTGAVRRVSGSWRSRDANASRTALDPIYDAAFSPCPENECGYAAIPSISADGRFVAFFSNYVDLYPGQPASDFTQVFLKDLHTGSVRMLSVNQSGEPANGYSFLGYGTAVSSDGRFVAFDSTATDLPGVLPSLGCTPGTPYVSNACRTQVYMADVERGTVTHVSRSATGVGAGNSQGSSISADGNHVAFVSSDDYLVNGDTNRATDVFSWDRTTGATTLVSVNSEGRQGAGELAPVWEKSGYLCIVLCNSTVITATSLALGAIKPATEPTGINVGRTIFTEIYTRMNGGTPQPTLSADGRYVTFNTTAVLAPSDTNAVIDVYVHDTVTGATVRVSEGPGGVQSNGNSFFPVVSADASTVAFTSAASNLASRDSNGSRWSVFTRPLNWTE